MSDVMQPTKQASYPPATRCAHGFATGLSFATDEPSRPPDASCPTCCDLEIVLLLAEGLAPGRGCRTPAKLMNEVARCAVPKI